MSEIKKIMFAEKGGVICPQCETRLTTMWFGGLGLLSVLIQTAYHTLIHPSESGDNSEEI